ncbi:MAG: hypothetical protein LBP75_11030 [Planctomycetota bacterium]|nr:hypothetical protein [Planctomycetota bacterium]
MVILVIPIIAAKRQGVTAQPKGKSAVSIFRRAGLALPEKAALCKSSGNF